MIGMATSDPETNQPKRMARRSGDTGLLAGLPWQVKAIANVGIPAVVAGVFIWFFLTTMTSAMRDHQQLLQQHTGDAMESNRLLREHLAHENEQSRLTLSILRSMCFKMAKDTKTAVNECWDGKDK